MLIPVSLLVFKDVGRLEDAQNRLAIKRLIKEIGEPRNYGLTDEEKAEEERKAAEEQLAREALEEAEREQQEAVETAERTARWEEWVRGSVCGSNLVSLTPPFFSKSLTLTFFLSLVLGGHTFT